MSLDTFFLAYIEAALWSSFDNSTPSGGYPLDKNYTIDDIDADSLASMYADCKRFYEENYELLTEQSDEYNGHDFWLTRNRHGVGFWDRGIEHGDALTEASRRFGESDLYVGDDGKLYVMPLNRVEV